MNEQAHADLEFAKWRLLVVLNLVHSVAISFGTQSPTQLPTSPNQMTR